MARFTVYNYFDHIGVIKKYVEDRKKQPEETGAGPEEKLKERQIKALIAETVRKMTRVKAAGRPAGPSGLLPRRLRLSQCPLS